MKNTIKSILAFAAALVCGGAWASTNDALNYWDAKYWGSSTSGNHDLKSPNSPLVFSGIKTLDELKEYYVYGTMNGAYATDVSYSNYAYPVMGVANNGFVTTDGGLTLQLQCLDWDGPHIKYANIKFTQGSDGIHATQTNRGYLDCSTNANKSRLNQYLSQILETNPFTDTDKYAIYSLHAIKKSEMTIPSAAARVISINMYESNDNGNVSVEQETLVGNIPANGWTQNGSTSQTTAYTVVKIYDAQTQQTSDAENVGVSWSVTGLAHLGNSSQYTDDATPDAAHKYMSSFLAKRDGSEAAGSISVTGIPFERYDVIVYFNGYCSNPRSLSGYWASFKHNHFTLDDNTSVNYNFNGRGELSDVKATCNHNTAKNAKPEWGRSGLATPVLGLNAGIIRGRNSPSFKIAATFQGSGVAAIQIVERPVSSYTATVSQDCSFNDIEWTPSLPADLSQAKLSLTTSGNPTIDLASAVSCAEIEINGEVKFTNQNNLTTKLTIPDGSTVSFGTATTFPGTVCGEGTLKIDLGTTGDASTSDIGIAARCLTEFQGTLHIVSGRYKPNSVLNANIKIKVTHGGQFWTCAGTWNNAFELSGRGWSGGSGAAVENTALRLGGNIGESATLNFVNDENAANTPTAIGSNDQNLTIAGTLEGDNGFEVRGSQAIAFLPTIQSSNLHGTILLTSGIKLGNNTNPALNTAYKLGDGQIEVCSGTTLTVHYGPAIANDYGTENKFLVGTKILLNDNSTIYVDDGAHRFSNITLKENSTATINLRWKKGWVFDALNIPSTSTFNLDVHNGDSRDVRIAVDGGTVDGTLKVTSASTNDLRIAPKGKTLANGTLQLTGTGNQCYVELRDNAKIGAVTGDKAGAVFTDGNAHTLTLSKGTTTCDLKDTATGKNTSSALSLVIDGTASVNSNLVNLSGSITVSGGNLSIPSTCSNSVTVQDGGKLKLIVSHAQNVDGYTATNITLNDGGVVEFWTEGASGLEKIDDSRVQGTTLEALTTIYKAEVSGSVNLSAINNWTCQGSEVGTRTLTASDMAQITLANDAVLTIDQDTSAFALTISGSGSIAVAENVKFAIHEALDATGIDITMAAGSSMAIAHAAKLTVNGKDETAAHATLKTADAITDIAGTGLVELNNISPHSLATAIRSSLTNSERWNGTVWVRNYNFENESTDDLKFFGSTEYGNAKSKIRFSGVTSWNKSSDSYTVLVPVELDNSDAEFALKITNGSSGKNIVFKHLSGSGMLWGNSGGATTVPVVIEEWEHFTGGVKMDAKVAVFGTTSDIPSSKTQGTIIVAPNKTVTQAAGTTWSGTFLGSGMVVADGRAPGGTFTNTGWTGTVWVKNVQDPILANFGNAGSKIKLTGVSHSAPNAFSITGEIELADDGETKAYTFGNWNSNNQTFNIATLTGDGTYAQSGFSWYGVPSKLMIGNAGGFRGGMIFTQPSEASQQKGGMWIVVGDTSPTLPGSDAHWHGRVYVQSGYTLGIGKSINSVTDNNYIAGTLKVWSDQAELMSSEFAEGSKIDLSEVGSMLTLSDTATGVTTVTVGDREIAVGNKLIAWNAKPENISLDLDKEGFFLRQTDEGAVVTACAAKIVSGEIEKVYYNTLADAVAEATAGQEIELLTDVSDAASITLDKNITIKVDGEADYTISTAFTGGAYTITKTGTGTLTLSGANTFSGGLTINAGTVKAGHDNALGLGQITVEEGAVVSTATFTMSEGGVCGYDIKLNGGSINNTTTGATANSKVIRKLTIPADKTGYVIGDVTGVGADGAATALALEGNLNVTMSGQDTNFYLRNTTVSGSGTLTMVRGNLLIYSTACTMANASVVIEANAKIELGHDLKVKNIKFAGGTISCGNYRLTVYGTLSKATGVTASIKYLTLGNEAHVDLANGGYSTADGNSPFNSNWMFWFDNVPAGGAMAFDCSAVPSPMPGAVAIKGETNNGYCYTKTVDDRVQLWVASNSQPIVTPEDAEEPMEITNVGAQGIAIAPNANVKVPVGTTGAKVAVKYTDANGKTTDLKGDNYVTVTVGDDGVVTVTPTETAKPAETAIAMSTPTDTTGEAPVDQVAFTITNPIPGLFYAVSSCDEPNGTFVTPQGIVGDQATSDAAKTVSIPMTFTGDNKVKYYKVSVKATK